MNRKRFARIKDGTADQSRRVCYVFGTVYIAGVKCRRKTSNLIFTAFCCLLGNFWFFHLNGRRYTNRRSIVFCFTYSFLNIINGRCDIQCDSFFRFAVYKFLHFPLKPVHSVHWYTFFYIFSLQISSALFHPSDGLPQRKLRLPDFFYFFIIFDQISPAADLHRLVKEFFCRKRIPHFSQRRRHNAAVYFNFQYLSSPFFRLFADRFHRLVFRHSAHCDMFYGNPFADRPIFSGAYSHTKHTYTRRSDQTS